MQPRMLTSLLVLSALACAQVEPNLWHIGSDLLHRVDRTGTILSSHAAACATALGPCLPPRIARDRAGSVYVAQYGFWAPGVSGFLRRIDASGVATSLSGAFSDLAFHPMRGSLFALRITFQTPTTYITQIVELAPGSLATIASAAATPAAAIGLCPTPTGMLALFANGAAEVIAVGASLTLGPLQPIITTKDLCAADASGRIFAYDPATSMLARFIPSGGSTYTLDWTYPLAGVTHLRLDAHGRMFALVPAGIARFSADGTYLGLVPSPFSLVDAFDVDSRDDLHVQVLQPGLVRYAISSAGLLLNLGFFLQAPAIYGDVTGTTMVRLAGPTIDSDGDGAADRLELQRGTDALDPTSAPPSLSAALSSPALPTAIQLNFQDLDPDHAGFPYLLGAALGTTTGIGLSTTTNLRAPLDLDDLLFASLTLGPPWFVGFSGTLNTLGQASATASLPLTLPAGLSLAFAGLTLHPATGLPTAISEATIVTVP